MSADAALRLAVEGGIVSLEAARLAIDAHLRKLVPAVGVRTVFAVELVLEEWLTNVFRHGTQGDGRVDVCVSSDGQNIEMRFEDGGPPFDPTAAALPARPASLEQASPGGRGLLLIRSQVRGWDYAREQGRNVLTVRIARDTR